ITGVKRYGEMIDVAYFSADGSYRADSPIINQARLAETLLNPLIAPMIFYNSTANVSSSSTALKVMLLNPILFYYVSNVHPRDFMTRKLETIMTVKDPYMPFRVSSMVYFWGVHYLLTVQGCANGSASNSGNKYCDIDTYDRCARNLEEASSLS
ncbi:hypothetical protein PFISCL1PPCAC_2474, partial [Pristionchus fissidentatus]